MSRDSINADMQNEWVCNKRTHEEINTDRILDEIGLYLESLVVMKDCFFDEEELDLERDELKDLMVDNHGLIFSKERKRQKRK